MMNAKELLRQTESLLLQNDHITLAKPPRRSCTMPCPPPP